jgi:tetratricopeptide (TPR) repeat protein
VREQPSNPAPLRALVWYLQTAGYLREALGIAERFVDLDPLSPAANWYLVDALNAVGRTSEAVAALELALQLDHDFAKWLIGEVNLMQKQDDIAIAHFEACLEQYGLPSNWVRELVTGARDPATGQAYLDRRIPQIVASMPEVAAYNWPLGLTKWYLYLGFLDRYFEVILDLDLADSAWTDAGTLVIWGTISRHLGFTAHPKYLEVAESLGIVDVWEQRGPPDFCEKMDGQWVCE